MQIVRPPARACQASGMRWLPVQLAKNGRSCHLQHITFAKEVLSDEARSATAGTLTRAWSVRLSPASCMTTTDQVDRKTEPPSMRPAGGIFRPLGFWASLLWFVIAFVVGFVAFFLLVVLVLFVTNADVFTNADVGRSEDDIFLVEIGLSVLRSEEYTSAFQ